MSITRAHARSGPQRGSSSLRSAAISVVVVVVANLGIFAVAALLLIARASAEMTRPVASLAAGPPISVAPLALPEPLARVAPVQRLIAEPVRYATAIRRKSSPASESPAAAPTRVSRGKTIPIRAGRNSL
jgi:hypothetical protein